MAFKKDRFGKPRDRQRSRVYAAENRAFADTIFLRNGDDVPTLEQLRTMVREVQQTAHYIECGGWQRLAVLDGRGRRSACWIASKRELRFPRWARSLPIVCHEVAHALACRTHGDRIEGHGGVFTRHYVELVRCRIGPNSAHNLLHHCRGMGVQVMGLEYLHKTRRK